MSMSFAIIVHITIFFAILQFNSIAMGDRQISDIKFVIVGNIIYPNFVISSCTLLF